MSQNYNGYFITSCGRVWSYKSNRFLSISKDKDGYEKVMLGPYGPKIIHRLVAETYLPNPDNFDTVDHVDFNREHNYVNNLRWLSRSENSGRKKNQGCRCIETGEVFNSITAAAKAYGKSREPLSNHLHGRQNTWCGYHWELI